MSIATFLLCFVIAGLIFVFPALVIWGNVYDDELFIYSEYTDHIQLTLATESIDVTTLKQVPLVDPVFVSYASTCGLEFMPSSPLFAPWLKPLIQANRAPARNLATLERLTDIIIINQLFPGKTDNSRLFKLSRVAFNSSLDEAMLCVESNNQGQLHLFSRNKLFSWKLEQSYNTKIAL